MTTFDDYKECKNLCFVSPTLLQEYDLSDFDWWKSRKIVVQRILEGGWLKGFYTVFNIYGGIEGFREIIEKVPYLSPKDIDFICVTFNLKKEELGCYTRKLLKEQLLSSQKIWNKRKCCRIQGFFGEQVRLTYRL